MTAQPAAPTLPGRAPGGLPPAALVAAYAALCLAPLALAAAQGLPARSLARELSAGLVMVGYAIALAQFVLSGRFEWLSGRVGIDRTMRAHQRIGWIVFALILAHPLLYVAPRLVSDPLDALVALQRMFAAPGLRSGVVAWWLLVLLVPLAVWRDRLPFGYELWRLGHGLLAVAFAVLGTHHTLRVGSYSADPWLAGFWLAATLAALLAMLHVYLVKPLLQLRAPYRVVENRRVAERMWEVAIAPERGAAIDFAAGQFVWLNLGHSPFSLTEHPFSISSAPAVRPRIAFTIKESGDFTGRIGTVAVGTRAYIDGPHGNFTPAGRPAGRMTFIAGGVGFAPVIGILRQLAAEGWPHPLRLVYGNRAEGQILYRDEIAALGRMLDLDVHLVLSEPPPGWSGPVGELTAPVLDACLGAPGTGDDGLFFVCGPPPMMDSVERALRARGVPRRRIVAERFRYD